MQTRLTFAARNGFAPNACLNCHDALAGVDAADPDAPDAFSATGGRADATRIHKALARPRILAASVDKELVLTSAMLGTPDAFNRFRSAIEAGYNETAGRDEELFRHLATTLDANHKAVCADIARHERDLIRTDEFIEIPGDGVPWTLGSVAKVSCLTLVSLFLLALGMLAAGTILINSGVAGFEPGTIWPYLFSAIPAASAWAIKCFALGITAQVWRRRAMVATLIAGVLLAVQWSYLFVLTFGGGMTASLSDIVNSVMADGLHPAGSGSGRWLLFVGLVAESFLAGGLFMAVELICERHHGPKRVPNPLYTPVYQAVLKCRPKEAELSDLLGLVQSRVSEIANGRTAYVGHAMSLYEAAQETLAHRSQMAALLNGMGFHQSILAKHEKPIPKQS